MAPAAPPSLGAFRLHLKWRFYMEKVLEIISWVVKFGPEIVSGVIGVLSGVIAIALIIPGDQPEKALKGVVSFLEKFSAKKGKEEGQG